MKHKLVLFALGLVALGSCQHKPIIHEDPTVTISETEFGDIYQNGDTIHIVMDVSDEESLEDCYLHVVVDTNITLAGYDPDTLLFIQPNVLGLSSYHLDTFCVVSGVPTGYDAVVMGYASNNELGNTSVSFPIYLVP